jgi:tight adherence protein B
MRAALQAGHGVVGALSVVADEFPEPAGQEFRRIVDEVRLGLPLRDALYNLIERVDDPNVPILVVGMVVAQTVGGNLAEVMDNISHTIRGRFKLLREVRVLTAQGRLSGAVLSVLPVLVGLLMFTFNRKYFTPMLTTPAGQHLLAYALASLVLGRLMIRRLVRIRV